MARAQPGPRPVMLLDMTPSPRTTQSKATSANMPKPPTATPSERPRWSASEAAKRCNVGRATILRAIADGRIEGAEQGEQGWQIPLEALLAAGFTPDRPTPAREQGPVVLDQRDRTIYELRVELAAERARADAAVALADAHSSHLQTALRMLEAPPVAALPAEPAKRWWKRS